MTLAACILASVASLALGYCLGVRRERSQQEAIAARDDRLQRFAPINTSKS